MTPPAKPYLLLADDDPDDQEMFVDAFLRRYPGATIHYCKDGREVLAYLGQCPTNELPLAMLLDYKMPVTTGAQVLEVIKDNIRFQRIRKLVWSTSNNKEFIDECLRYGADRYFVKPNDVRQMDEIVAYIVAIFKTQRA